MSDGVEKAIGEVGYCRPPQASRFQKGKSGNPRGRPRNRRREIPYDQVLGQMVTIRENGRERRVTAAEAFLLQLTRKGLQGDSAAARASLAAIEEARSKRLSSAPEIMTIVCKMVSPGSVGCSLDALAMAVKLRRYTEEARYAMKPWLVELALARLGSRTLTVEEQRIVVEATHKPEQVTWPHWWEVRP
jgi:hypothetical protein